MLRHLMILITGNAMTIHLLSVNQNMTTRAVCMLNGEQYSMF